ncbi:Flavodoxin [Dethiosulfatibacter aminovorans DSM 17477]|uniref:Flavodoxin n=1 Tax=Dethiosulfatibacter aminovorans DSM 17477 TaxID=1121476 RepID=A0A1M6I2M6_9FIRM|nr:flavodoxin domain-containing protein [Dethiosulfatibacter aminovorans]SHJ28729.1 Flavodoxin [Dethiosulfatibacter aminovorans DSM 17477]
MKGLIVYDSYFGNTEKVAIHIHEALKEDHEVKLVKIHNVEKRDLENMEFIVIGSPTRAFKATKAIMDFIKRMPKDALLGVKAAAFDTRMNTKDVNSKILNALVNVFGYAAEPMGKALAGKGATLVIPPEGFYVSDSEGPLKDGELERAEEWIRKGIK